MAIDKRSRGYGQKDKRALEQELHFTLDESRDPTQIHYPNEDAGSSREADAYLAIEGPAPPQQEKQ